MTYRVRILSTGETIETTKRFRNYQLWHEFLMSGYDDFDEWEMDEYPEDTTPRDVRRRHTQFWRDTWAFLDELDQMTREILRAPIDWAQVRAEYEQQARDASTREVSRMLDEQIKETDEPAQASRGDQISRDAQTLRAAE
jgi:hypothetical protein